MVPLSCTLNTSPIAFIAIYRDGNLIDSRYYYDQVHYPILLEEANYEAGQELTVSVQYDWKLSPAPDYTVKVYS